MFFQLANPWLLIFSLLITFNILSSFFKKNNAFLSLSILSLSANLVAVLFSKPIYLPFILTHLYILLLLSKKISKKINILLKNNSTADQLNSILTNKIAMLSLIVSFFFLVANSSFDFASNKEMKILIFENKGVYFSLIALYSQIIFPVLALTSSKKLDLSIICLLGIFIGLTIGSGGLIFTSTIVLAVFFLKTTATRIINTYIAVACIIYYTEMDTMSLSNYANIFLARLLESGVGNYLVLQDNLALDTTFLNYLYSRFWGSYGDVNHWAAIFQTYGRWGEFGGPNDSSYALAFSSIQNISAWIYISFTSFIALTAYQIDINGIKLPAAIVVISSYSLIQDSTGSILFLKKAIILSIFFFIIRKFFLPILIHGAKKSHANKISKP